MEGVAMSFTAIIKGNELQARQACVQRGLGWLGRVKEINAHESKVTFPNRHFNAVVEWFCEPNEGAPYPIGTCLLYSTKKEE